MQQGEIFDDESAPRSKMTRHAACTMPWRFSPREVLRIANVDVSTTIFCENQRRMGCPQGARHCTFHYKHLSGARSVAQLLERVLNDTGPLKHPRMSAERRALYAHRDVIQAALEIARGW